MAIDSIAPKAKMDRSCSASASDTSRGDGEPRPEGDEMKGKPTEPGVVCLKPELMEAPPGYLTLSLTRSCARTAAKYRSWKRTGEVSLAYVDAPRDYLSLSLTPSDQPKRRRGGRDVSRGGGSGVADASSVAPSSTAVVVGGELPPPPVQIPATCLPPKKRNLAAAAVHQETAGTAPDSSSPCLALATVNHQDGVTRPSSLPGDGETRPSATMAFHPIDAVPLQAVYVHGGVPYQFRLSSGTREIITTNDAASTSSSAPAGSSCPPSSSTAPVTE